MSASFVDALLGYEFYLTSRGSATIDEVNDYLQKQRRAPIALRTYHHYRKLISHGFRSYVPINKFDVFQSLGRLQMAADRRRYSRRQVGIPAEVSRNRQDWYLCTILNMSLVGFGVTTESKFPSRPGNLVWLRMEQYDPIPCFIAWRKHKLETTDLGLRAQEFIENYRTAAELDASERLSGRYIIVREDDSEIDWGYLVTYLEKSDELIGSVKDMILAVAESVGKDVIIPRSVLDHIQFGSPGGAEIKIDFGVADIIKTIFDSIQTFGLQRKRYKAETESIELENERKGLENTQRKIEIVRNALNLQSETQSRGIEPAVLRDVLGSALRNALQLEELPDTVFEDNTLEKGILEERVLPSFVEVTNGDDPSYNMRIDQAYGDD